MQALVYLLLSGASLSAVYAAKLRRLELAVLGVLLSSIFIVQAGTPGDVRWGVVVVILNLLAGAFIFGHRRGASVADRSAAQR